MMEQFDSMGVLEYFSLCLYLCTMHLSLILSLLWSMESRHRAKADVCFSKQHAQSEDGIPRSIAMTISMINAWYIGKDIRKNVLELSCYQIAPSYRKMCDFKQSHKYAF